MIALESQIDKEYKSHFFSVVRPNFVFLKDYPNVEILTKNSLLKKKQAQNDILSSQRIVGISRKINGKLENSLIYEKSLSGDYCILTDDNLFLYIALWLDSPWGFAELLNYDFLAFSGVITKQSLENAIIPYLDNSSSKNSIKLLALELIMLMKVGALQMLKDDSEISESMLQTAGNFFTLLGYYGLMEIIIPDEFENAGIEILYPWSKIMAEFGTPTEENVKNMVLDVIKHVLTTNNELRTNVNKMKYFSSQFRLKIEQIINMEYMNLK